MKKKLQIGICIDKETVPLWIYNLIKQIIYSDFSEVKTIIVNDNLNFKKSKIPFFYKLHEILDSYIFRSKFNYDEKISLNNIICDFNINTLHLNTYTTTNTKKVSKIKNNHTINKYTYDILLDFSTSQLLLKSYISTKYGIWKYKVGLTNKNDQFLNTYWEIVNRLSEIIVYLSVSGIDSNEEVLIYQGNLAPYTNSLHINRDQIYKFGELIILKIIKDIHLNGEPFIQTLKSKYNKRIKLKYKGVPSPFQSFINLVKLIYRILHIKLFYLIGDEWVILYKINGEKNPLHIKFANFKVINPPKDRFWADPFIIIKKNLNYIFVEEYVYNEGKGRICVLELDGSGKLISSNKVLEKSYHLSYPYVFEWEGKFYMIPETSENNTIELYKSTHFPHKWEFVTNLMENIKAVDTTPFYHNKKWWLFTKIKQSKELLNYDELHLFYSNDLLSKIWTPHPENPIVTDIKTARPAGKIFIHDNKIYRPSQDCSGRYGRAFNINQITLLTEKAYKESTISKIEANWNPHLKGTHTFNFNEKITVIDAYRFRKRLFDRQLK